jgi:hypothetical protein
MKKINKSVLLLIVAAMIGQSCKKELIDTNTNPNKLDDVNPEFLFTGATVDINYAGRDRPAHRYGRSMTYMQYVAADATTLEGLSGAYWDPTKNTGPNPGFYYYNDYFTGVGRDMNRIIAKINEMPADRQATYQGLKAMCIIVDTYHAWRVADVFGALPYSQAFQDVQYPLPAYDYDYNLYKVFDQKLKDAATLLKNNPTGQADVAAQDFFYAGAYDKWQAFANTLRIKIAQRYQKRDAANFTGVLTDIATNFSSKIISSVDEAFAYKHTRDYNNNVDDINSILLNYNASYAFVEYLKSTSDPRLQFMVRENDLGTNYSGYLNAQNNGTPAVKAALELPENKVRYYGKHAFPASVNGGFGITAGLRNIPFDLVGAKTQSLGVLSAIQTRLFVKNGGFGGFDARSSRDFMHTDEAYVDGSTIKMKSLYLSYAETCFMMAEIAATGGNGLGKTAAQWYDLGIDASFNQYKALAVATLVPNAASITIGTFKTKVPYNGLPSIYSQAWVNFLVQPDEAWAMWKRTGYPQFEDVRAGVPNKIGNGSGIAYLENLYDGSKNLLIPRRSALQLSTGSNPNADNYNKAIQGMIAKDPAYGKDAIDTKGRIWWDMQ